MLKKSRRLPIGAPIGETWSLWQARYFLLDERSQRDPRPHHDTHRRSHAMRQIRHPAGTGTSTNVRLTEAEIHSVSMASRTVVGSHR